MQTVYPAAAYQLAKSFKISVKLSEGDVLV